MSSYFKKGPKFIKTGDKFVVKIVAWNCATAQPDPNIKRGLEPDIERVPELAERALPDSIDVPPGELRRLPLVLSALISSLRRNVPQFRRRQPHGSNAPLFSARRIVSTSDVQTIGYQLLLQLLLTIYATAMK
jgi:hypothetical protein